jgi:hypothetical protein
VCRHEERDTAIEGQSAPKTLMDALQLVEYVRLVIPDLGEKLAWTHVFEALPNDRDLLPSLASVLVVVPECPNEQHRVPLFPELSRLLLCLDA